MAKGKAPIPQPEQVIDQSFNDILSERYLSYALSTIMSRSLPDVRDGLKPVHRRLMYAMNELKLNPNQAPKKSARVVGDVIGKYHPHGDVAVYDAMVRMAQDFAQRYPLVDGQGNFGNIDGDNAAAMRYTEARLTDVALMLLDGLEENAVDFRANYDGSEEEPVVLPGGFPNLLANGSSGIAVGMATNIPPHNVEELCEAMELMLSSDQDISIKDLVKIVKGPDFPTGGMLVSDKKDILEAYETGKGTFRIRAKWKKEELKRDQYQIVVTEIPYQVQKSKLIEKIAELITNKKLPMLDDVRDESAEDIRLVLIPKSRNIEAELLMEALYRNTDLETRFALNMNVLDGGLVPRVMNLKEVLQAWLNHQQEVLVRRSTHRLQKVKHRIEILDGYLIAYLNLDEVIHIIRTEDEPKPKLMKKFKLTDVQAEAILNMRLRSLRKLEEFEIKGEHKNLSDERDELEKLIGSEKKQWAKIKKQIADIKKMFGSNTDLGKRRTKMDKAPSIEIAANLDEALTEKEPVTVIMSDKGWVRGMKGHGHNAAEFKYKDGDRGQFVLEAQTTDKLLVFGTNGRFYTVSCDKLPPGRGFGEPIRLMIDLPNDADVAAMMVFQPDRKILVVATDGRGFIVPSNDALAQTKAGKQVLGVDGKTEAKVCRYINEGDDHIAVTGNGKMLVFKLEQVPEMSKGKGVKLMSFKGNDLSDAKTFNWKGGLTYKSGSSEAKVTDLRGWLGERAQAGKLPPNGFPKNKRFD